MTRTTQDRRTFLGAAAAALLPLAAGAQTPRPRPVAELARHTLTGPFEGWEVVLVELNMAPAERSSSPAPGHRHPGPVLGYVAEGQVHFGLNHEPEKVVPTGGTFFEPIGAVHTTNRSASAAAPARAVVFMLVPKGSPLTAPE